MTTRKIFFPSYQDLCKSWLDILAVSFCLRCFEICTLPIKRTMMLGQERKSCFLRIVKEMVSWLASSTRDLRNTGYSSLSPPCSISTISGLVSMLHMQAQLTWGLCIPPLTSSLLKEVALIALKSNSNVSESAWGTLKKDQKLEIFTAWVSTVAQ